MKKFSNHRNNYYLDKLFVSAKISIILQFAGGTIKKKTLHLIGAIESCLF